MSSFHWTQLHSTKIFKTQCNFTFVSWYTSSRNLKSIAIFYADGFRDCSDSIIAVTASKSSGGVSARLRLQLLSIVHLTWHCTELFLLSLSFVRASLNHYLNFLCRSDNVIARHLQKLHDVQLNGWSTSQSVCTTAINKTSISVTTDQITRHSK